MAGLVPAIHVFLIRMAIKTWMPATSAGMTGREIAHQSPTHFAAAHRRAMKQQYVNHFAIIHIVLAS
jgi:hypothetical protein